jgi:hypothetical protein
MIASMAAISYNQFFIRRTQADERRDELHRKIFIGKSSMKNAKPDAKAECRGQRVAIYNRLNHLLTFQSGRPHHGTRRRLGTRSTETGH